MGRESWGDRQWIVESVDEVYELLSHEVSRLQELYFKHAVLTMDVGKTCLNRGIRPTFFFQSSFQLLEKENEENLVDPIWLRKFM
ncbi:hypothetical protein Glove_71g108 [Diversispora epigaea]|uniref:Uncharacterized protein n=1 Tax=Diversispora epigaea TaxID=1348612 RepID=A0A397JE98_9GLOM|nr:hypothetical protein Glove_71g108 [Diversispora epigaea]